MIEETRRERASRLTIEAQQRVEDALSAIAAARAAIRIATRAGQGAGAEWETLGDPCTPLREVEARIRDSVRLRRLAGLARTLAALAVGEQPAVADRPDALPDSWVPGSDADVEDASPLRDRAHQVAGATSRKGAN
jgi:hypothetical protein